MYIVLAKGRSLAGLEGLKGVKELTGTGGGEHGERLFVLKKDLKRD